MKTKEASGIIRHEIIPNLSPQLSGFFSVKFHGGDNLFAELELEIVDPKTKQILHSFGRVTVARGRNATLEGLESTINFLPKELS